MKKNKLVLTATAVVFIGMITALPLSWYLKPEEQRVSSSENRELAPFPTLEEPEDIRTFPKAFDSWYSDHLPYKENMVSLKSQAEIELFRELDSDQVILGTEQPWLFYKAADGQPIETYKRTNQFSDENLTKITEVLTGLQDRLSEKGIEFVLMISPDKETIYGPDYMPPEIKVMTDRVQRTDQLIAYLAEHAPELRVLYPKDAMLQEKEGLAAAAEAASGTAAAEATTETAPIENVLTGTAEGPAGVGSEAALGADGSSASVGDVPGAPGNASVSGEYTAWPLYYESDTHWNKIGAKIAADELFALLAAEDRSWLAPYHEITFSDLGDGSDEAYPAGEVMKKEGDMQKLCKLPAAYDSTEFRAEGVLPADLTYLITSPSGERVYEVYHSSDSRAAKKSLYFASDSFRWNITDFLKGQTEDSLICSRYYLDLDDVEARRPDVFVYMIAERYLHELEGLPGVVAPALEYTEEFQKADIY